MTTNSPLIRTSLVVLFAACGSGTKSTPVEAPTAPSVPVVRFGGSALAPLIEETILFADATLRGEPPPPMTFLAPDNARGVRAEMVEPTPPLNWLAGDLRISAIVPLSTGAYAYFDFELFVGPRGTRLVRASAAETTVAPPAPSPTVPAVITAEVHQLLERARASTLSEIRVAAQDVSDFANPTFVDRVVAKAKETTIATDVTSLASRATGAPVVGIRNIALVGIDSEGTVWIASADLVPAGGRHVWKCDPDDCRVFETQMFPYLPLALWQSELTKMCDLAGEFAVTKMAVPRKRQLFFERVPKTTTQPVVRAHFQADSSGKPNFLVWHTDFAALGGPPDWSCKAIDQLFSGDLSPKPNPR